MKTLYLHIGHYKTGTSAIQKYLSENADDLAKHDYYYPPTARPRSNPTTHGDLSLTIASKHGFQPPAWYKERKDLDEVYAEFLADCRAAPQQNIVASSEEFFQLALRNSSETALEDLRDRLVEFDVRIVLFIREPFALLKSWFGEVNKGPFGTRPFPVFFKNLESNFLSQNLVYRRFAAVFGAEKMIVKSYKHYGLDHIRDFLSAIHFSPLPEGDEWRVNEGQDIRFLEMARLAKQRNCTYEEATLSKVGDMKKLEAKVEEINSDFAAVSQLSDMPQTSELSLENVFGHYRDLIAPLVEIKGINNEEASVLRDAAIKVEASNLKLARILMETALLIRPGGSFIRDKVKAYELKEQDLG